MQRITKDFDDYPDYFCWLCEMICVDGRYSDCSYWALAKILWNTDFYWLLDMDSDRAADGIALRNRYEREGGQYNYSGPCTVLEMLVALADRIDCILDELDGECKITMIFWEMIDNLGMISFSDNIFESHAEELTREANHCIERWLDRDIDYDGNGGLFPLRDPKEDQRNVTIWYQANAYLLENYQ